ncbi:hypothetical protein ciss_05210 [Carboxydothermus islandicus]|uniref:Uncharacterized protein n=1 Tax=Carboxydothermus islandicus TaxID=661089 RepID=A0A1L8D0B2_9THEO|nr:hypothetical protein [Carboxydothermus islandicus]GAV24588.1 hypothetical protein ciss_05210 [Carboxydothermus islandicus]
MNLSLKHLFILLLLFTVRPKKEKDLHNLIYLLYFYGRPLEPFYRFNFIKQGKGVFSPYVQQLLGELRQWELVEKDSLNLTPKGRETYMEFSSLIWYEPTLKKFYEVSIRYAENPDLITRDIRLNLPVQKTPPGKKINI